jgi:predicted methyltransferase
MFYDSKNRNNIENRNKIESKWRNIMKIIKNYRFINMKLINHSFNNYQNFSQYPEYASNSTYLI